MDNQTVQATRKVRVTWREQWICSARIEVPADATEKDLRRAALATANAAAAEIRELAGTSMVGFEERN